MLVVDYRIEMGSARVRDFNGNAYTVKFHPANCRCGAFIDHYTDENGRKMSRVWAFLESKEHITRIMKNSASHKLFGNEVLGVKLNVYFKEARMLVEPCAKSGYKVTCYYEEPKKK